MMLRTSNRITLQFAAALLAFCTTSIAQAQVVAAPSQMNFQGRLARPDGTPVADSTAMQTYNLTLSLWDAASGGTKLWEQTFTNVGVKNGTFAVTLNVGANFQNGATASTLFGGNRYLEVKVNDDTPLAPRQALQSVPYALKANTVPDGSIGATQLMDNSVNASKLAVDAASLLKVSGNVMNSNGSMIGINTTPHADYALTLKASASQGTLLFRNNADQSRWHFVLNADGGSNGLNIVESGIADNRMYFKPGGNVGIGTNNPGRRLQVGDPAVNSVGVIRVGQNGNSTSRAWDFGIGDAGLFGHRDNFGFKDNTGNTILTMQSSGQGGRVGIGTNTPGMSLEVTTPSYNNRPAIGGSSGSAYAYLLINPDAHSFTWDNDSVMRFGSETGRGTGYVEQARMTPASEAAVDQAQTVTTSATSNNVAQSFTPSRSGKITQVRVFVGNSDTGNISIPISILTGEGINGTQLVRQNLTVPPGGASWRTLTLNTPVPVTAGQLYTVWLEGAASQQYNYAANNPYPGGRMLYGPGNNPNHDLAFETVMTRPGEVNVQGTLSVDVTSTAANGLHIRTPNANAYAIRLSNAQTSFETGMFVTNDGFFQVTNSINGGAFARLNSAGTWTSTSDRRMKKEIEPLTGLLEKTLALRPVSYLFRNEDTASIQRHIGFIAQEVETLFPSLVSGSEIKTLDYSGLSVAAVGAIQEMHAKMNRDQKRLSALETENAELKAQLAELAAAVREMQQKQNTNK